MKVKLLAATLGQAQSAWSSPDPMRVRASRASWRPRPECAGPLRAAEIPGSNGASDEACNW